MKYILASAAVLILLVFGVWMVAIPGELILGLINNSVGDATMHVECSGFKKGLFFSFSADSIALKKNDRQLMAVENVSARIDLLSVIGFKLPVVFSGDLAEGTLKGSAELLRKGREISLTFDDINTGAIPFLGLLGIEGSGLLTGRMEFKNNNGEVRFDVKELRNARGRFGDISIPLNDFRSAQGALEVAGSKVRVKSFTMEGPDIYARISGEVAGGKLNLTLEVMPEKAFSDRNPVFAVLERYKVSPGRYAVPLTNTLAF